MKNKHCWDSVKGERDQLFFENDWNIYELEN